MIQRIQTIFLLLAGVAAGLQLWLPYLLGQTNLVVFEDKRFDVYDNNGLLGLSLLAAVLGIINIFIYSNRPLQARIAGAGIFVSFMTLLLLGFTIYQIYNQAPGNVALNMGAGLFLSPLAAVLFWLAMRAIRKDERLVRSMDRLR